MSALGKLLLTSLIALGLGAPAFAAGGAHGFVSHTSGLQHVRPHFAARGRNGLGGLGASGAYTTLLSGTFPTQSPDVEAGIVLPPPYYVVPANAPPPCVKPVLIHLTPPRHVKLPRVVYGSPFTCN